MVAGRRSQWPVRRWWKEPTRLTGTMGTPNCWARRKPPSSKSLMRPSRVRLASGNTMRLTALVIIVPARVENDGKGDENRNDDQEVQPAHSPEKRAEQDLPETLHT